MGTSYLNGQFREGENEWPGKAEAMTKTKISDLRFLIYDLRFLRHKLLAPAIGLLACSLFLSCSGPQTPKPNIVLIMADDMGFSDLGCYGGEIDTPNLDHLAANGVRFTQFYNAARCCPTRAALLTGLYTHQVGLGGMVSRLGQKRPPGPYQGYISENSVTIAEALKSAGYKSYMSGKWHVGEDPENWPLTRGFDKYFGLISGASSYFETIKNQPRVRQMVLDSTRWEPPAEGFYMTDAISDYAVERIAEHTKGEDAPFFLYVAYTAPHFPLHALPEDIDKYRGFYDIGWDSLRTLRFDRLHELGIFDEKFQLSERTSGIPSWDDAQDHKDWSLRMAVYAAMIDRMDQGIGKIVAALQENGHFENTITFFLSDNGASPESVAGRGLHNPAVEIGSRGSYAAYREPWANASNTPFRFYKKWVHEGGIASPLIVHWPAGLRPKGAISKQVGHVIDLLPTLLHLAGVSYPKMRDGRSIPPVAGRSLRPAFETGTAFDRGPLFWEHLGNRAIRDGNRKLVAQKDGPWELYDLDKDRTELHNLASVFPEKVEELQKKYDDWANRVGATQ